MEKKFRLRADEIKPLATGHGACIASDQITVEGYPVRWMYRKKPYDQYDSGWIFSSGYEDDEYANNPDNHAIYDVNTIANYDPTIIPFLDHPPVVAFEKTPESERFIRIDDWKPGED